MPAVGYVDDRMALKDLMIRYGVALDQRDWEGLRGVFLPDARVRYMTSPELEGFEATRDFCERALSRFRITQHLLGNFRAEIDGDRARTATELQALHVMDIDGGEEHYFVWGTYRDTVVRTAEGWKIAERWLEQRFTQRLFART